jgi:hypothetical protein
MSPEVIQRCLDERPFKPLTVFLSDQNEVSVNDPAEAELTSDGTALQVTHRGSRLIIAVGQIVSIQIGSREGGLFGFGS